MRVSVQGGRRCVSRGPVSTLVAIATLAAVSGGACADGGQREEVQLATRDSAGVQIAEIQGDPWRAPVWATIDTANAFRITPDDARPETLFGRVRGTLRLSDGTIAVLDIGRHQIRIFAADGSLVRSIGRHGQGPGELDAPWRLIRAPGDSLGVVDIAGYVELFSATGDGSRRMPMPRGSETGSPQILGPFAEGGYLAILNEFPGKPRAGINPLFSTLHVVTPNGASGPTLGRYQSAQFSYREGGDGRLHQVPALFWAEPGMAVLPAGYVWCLATEFDCQIRSNTGVHLRTIRASVATDAVTRADVAELTKIQLAGATTAADSTRVHESIAEADRMERFPVLSLIRTGRDGRIWMREFVWRAEDRSATWLVFEPTGRVLGTVTTPARLQVFDIGDGYILGVERDEDDAEGIVMYSFLVAR